MVMTSAYDLPSVQTLGRGKEADVSPSWLGGGYVIAGVKFCISSYSLVSAVNRMAARTLREKKKKKNQSFFPLNFNVYIYLNNRERARTRNK